MKYKQIVKARFIDRPNRFIAIVELNGKEIEVHVKNTGRCLELLLPGYDVILVRSDNPNRKTLYDLVAVYKPGLGWVNIDSQAPNAAVKEWLQSSPDLFPGITLLKPEYTYRNSRVDFYLECRDRRILIEVKGCTLERKGIGYFPDAPTARGVKHLRELTAAVEEGYECVLAFVIAMPEVRQVLPNTETHPEFGDALTAALTAGVQVLYLPCSVTPDTIRITECIFLDKTK